MQEALKACSNVSAPGSDHITWRHLKLILANYSCAVGILSLANACLSLQHWPRHFKKSVSVIILKPAYDTPKAFRPIVLLNTLGKLIEKMIARRLQFDTVKYSILNHQFVTRCSIAVHGRLSTTSSLQFWPQETKNPLIGRETQLESIETYHTEITESNETERDKTEKLSTETEKQAK